MKTKLLLLALVLFSSVMAWAQNLTQNGVNYYIDDTTAYVGESPDAAGDITILDKITVDGTDYPVTKIGDNAFSYNEGITSVVVPNSVERIGDYSFRDCLNMLTATIGSGVTYIGGDAFFCCYAITDVYISANSETLEWDDWGYDDFNSDGNTICHVDDASAWSLKFPSVNVIFRDPTTIPFNWSYDEATHTLTISGTEAMPSFRGYNHPWKGYRSDIKNIIIEDGVRTIGDYAFYYCSSLKSVSIPSSVTSIGESAFWCCKSLSDIEIPASVAVIKNAAFFDCESLRSIILPSSLTQINSEAFRWCYSLKDVTIPSSVNVICSDAFSECNSLQSITIPASVEELSPMAFPYCEKLTAINVDSENPVYMSCNGAVYTKDVTTLYLCPSGKTSIEFADGVKRIGEYAFYCCDNFTSVTLPNTMTALDAYAFTSCSNLRIINIPASITGYIDYAFSYCNNLDWFNVADDNPIYKSVDGAIYRKDDNRLVKYPNGRTSFVIPDDVTIIGDCACIECHKFTSVTIPNQVATIGCDAFYDCNNLETVTIGSGVTDIHADAFYASQNITDVYCYANPADLKWDDGGYDEFGEYGNTVCHVFDADAFKAKWSTGDTDTDVCVIFQGDLLPQVTTAEMCDADLTTYYNSAENVKVDLGTTVYKVSFNGSQVTATEIEDRIINAGQGVMLRSNDRAIAMATTTETSSADYSDNVLEGVDVATSKAAGYKYYTLGQSGSELGFYEFLGSTPLPAHKAFIKSASGPASGYKFDAATGISDLNVNDNLNGAIYNLSGQRLNKMQKGINIIGGKKVLVK